MDTLRGLIGLQSDQTFDLGHWLVYKHFPLWSTWLEGVCRICVYKGLKW